MSYQIRFGKKFLQQVKRLAKRHRSLKADLARLVKSLQNDPYQGNLLLPNVRKIRLAIKSKGRGKSGGARVITYAKERPNEEAMELIYLRLALIYDKSDEKNVSDKAITQVILTELSEEE